MPAFYVGGESLDRFLDAYAMRLLDCLGIATKVDSDLRWSGGSKSGPGLADDDDSRARSR